MYEEIKSSGVTAGTPKEILFGAGTVHIGAKLTEGKWNFDESLVGSTSGGNKIMIKPELQDISVDGVMVKVKGLTKKVGETATMEINFAEATPAVLEMAVIGEAAESEEYSGYTEITSHADIQSGDYIENLAVFTKKLDGTPIIILFDHALCTSGMDNDNQHKSNTVVKLTFECYAEIGESLETLPFHILYPTPAKGGITDGTDI